MGLSLAAFQSDLLIKGTFTTGTVEVSYEDCWFTIEQKGQQPRGAASISCSGNSLNVTIEDAEPGFQVTYYFEIENFGTLPVKLNGYDVSDSTMPDNIELKNLNFPDLIQGGASETGSFTLHVKGQVDEGEYDFNLSLHYILQNFAD